MGNRRRRRAFPCWRCPHTRSGVYRIQGEHTRRSRRGIWGWARGSRGQTNRRKYMHQKGPKEGADDLLMWARPATKRRKTTGPGKGRDGATAKEKERWGNECHEGISGREGGHGRGGVKALGSRDNIANTNTSDQVLPAPGLSCGLVTGERRAKPWQQEGEAE